MFLGVSFPRVLFFGYCILPTAKMQSSFEENKRDLSLLLRKSSFVSTKSKKKGKKKKIISNLISNKILKII